MRWALTHFDPLSASAEPTRDLTMQNTLHSVTNAEVATIVGTGRTRVSLLSLCLLAGLAACNADAPATATADAAAAPTDASSAPVATDAATTADAAPAAATATPVELAPAQLQAVVDGMLKQAYGADAFNAGKSCWTHTFETPNDELEYCMKVGKPQVVATSTGTQVYFQTTSDWNAGLYSQVDPGLRGLFAATVSADGKWEKLAASPALDQGEGGQCGCENDTLVQVGPERHGWKGLAGGMWQGVAVTSNTLYVPMDGSFVDVSGIPNMTEGNQAESTEIAIDTTGTPVDGFYPVKATVMRDGKATGTTVVAFDPQKKTYPWAK